MRPRHVQLDGEATVAPVGGGVVERRAIPSVAPAGQVARPASVVRAGPDDPVDALIAARRGRGVIHYWHLLT